MSTERADKLRGGTVAALTARSGAGHDALSPRRWTPEVRQLVAELSGEIERLKQDLDEARAKLEYAERAADQDHLLPVLNRRAFMRALSRQIGLTARYGMPASLLFIDLDGFKRINDAYGHAAGDTALAHFAAMLCRKVRESDVVGRLGGDEFGVVLAHAGKAQAEKKAQALMDELNASAAEWNGSALAVSFSYGVFELGPGDTADSALMRADEAMYARKRMIVTR